MTCDVRRALTSPQLQNIAFKVDLEKNLIGINTILLWAKFLKYVSAHKTFSRITRTIGLAASEIAIFFLIFALSMFGFAMGGVRSNGILKFERLLLLLLLLCGGYAHEFVVGGDGAATAIVVVVC